MYKYLFFFLGLIPAGLSAQVADSSRREVRLQGAANFRDLGGYTSHDGHHIRWGCVYRSADISKLTDSDLVRLKDRHILSVVDLRGAHSRRGSARSNR